ncbi:unnamed protein product [Zymoseptoria tritici ST99CH_1E4]|uniref:Uncharacterized protein n=1 Tax=Zymoseptoria tritici ST99CH_1E4 TaxID=1276532 RepID=A0A2H1FJP0_ZYMTR|nr:unnamed protein product [Zymoseptoria tritici ST99CH_1E4]
MKVSVIFTTLFAATAVAAPAAVQLNENAVEQSLEARAAGRGNCCPLVYYDAVKKWSTTSCIDAQITLSGSTSFVLDLHSAAAAMES